MRAHTYTLVHVHKRTQVKHDYSDMNDGETVVLTLADKALLQRKGLSVAENEDDDDELENVLKVWMALCIEKGVKACLLLAEVMDVQPHGDNEEEDVFEGGRVEGCDGHINMYG